MERAPLPASLHPVFTVSEARAAGVSASRLRAADLDRPFRGLRTRGAAGPDGSEPGDPAADARHCARLLAHTMPANQFFSHVTAAVLWGLPLSRRVLVDAEGGPRPLDVGVFAPRRHPRHVGVRGHQVRPALARVVTHPTEGIPVATPASTWGMLASVIRDPYDLVAVGDALVRESMFEGDPPPLATVEQLRAVVEAGRRVGSPLLRLALDRVRTRSASRTETRCRLLLVDAGLPEPVLNHHVYDERGRFVACVDLAYPDRRVAVEYEGEHHLHDPDQWARDIRRHERLREAGWVVIRVTKDDLFRSPAALVACVRRVL